ncbi:MAG: insulinase family protein, partial [Verrucomicrobiota bacterium]|nr:insulinase family protein [Verrucomicrobiota bacterium]
LCDMYLNSTFAPADIEREREVIREEIMMYRDHPAQHAQELLSETMWPDHPLGRPLTGTMETITSFNRQSLLQYMNEHYNGRTTIVTVAGRVRHDEVVALFEPSLRKLNTGTTPRFRRSPKVPGHTRISLFTQETEQIHLAMGFFAFGRRDERRYALKLLSVILGENMSSRLFQKLREQYGFCYSVQSGMVALADAGLINVYAGLDAAKARRAMQVVFKEFERMSKRKALQGELRKAQDYTIGQALMGLESTTNQMMWMGESILGYGKILDPIEIERRILAVTADDIREAACFCFQRGRLGIAVVGPVKTREEVEAWLK